MKLNKGIRRSPSLPSDGELDYMMNLMALSAFRFLLYRGTAPDGDPLPYYWAGSGNLALYAAAVIAATIALALPYRWLCDLARRPLTA